MGFLNNFLLLKISSDQQRAIEILQKNRDIFHNNSESLWLIIIGFFKSLAWKITIGLHKLVSFLNEVLNSIITFGGILDDKKVVELSNAMTPIALSLMALMIAVIGFMVMFGQRIPISQFLLNIKLAGLFIVTVLIIFSTLQRNGEG